MQLTYIVFLAFAVMLLAGCGSQSAERLEGLPEIPSNKNNIRLTQPVLVELFTSEGCSSCPPADRGLTFLQTQQPVSGAEIITLAFHVDYWDRLGWKDRFSSAQFSRRQEQYAQIFRLDSVYTPQLVIDGEAEVVGSELGKANDSIAKVSAKRKGSAAVNLSDGKLNFVISDITGHRGSTVFLAIAEDRLTTNVRAGENSGKTLEHTAVVRELRPIGSLESAANSLRGSTEIDPNQEWKKDNLKFVVFVQENDSRKILAVGKAAF